ncbi:helix-turn-helix domain-containing protein [Streptomyces sp. NPDC054933]
MASKAQAPYVQLRRLGRELRKLREDSGLTIEEAGKRIDRSDSTISRIETAVRAPQKIELKGLLEAYGADAETTDFLLGLLRDVPEQGWWTAHEDAFPRSLEIYIGLETDASALRVFALGAVHSLLRTEDYARAILRAGLPTSPEKDIDKLVAAHMQRQQVLTREPQPVDLQVVLDEASLRRRVGNQEVMRDQLDRLIHCAEEVPNITLHVLPFSKGAHGSPTGGFTIIDFPDPTEPATVYLDTPGGNLYLQKPHDTRRFDQMYGRLCGAALDTDDSVQFLRTVREEMR